MEEGTFKKEIRPGSIEKVVEVRKEFRIIEWPELRTEADGGLTQPVVEVRKAANYQIHGIRVDYISAEGGNGREAKITADYGAEIGLWERVRLVFKLFNHVFDPSYWGEHVKKRNALTEENMRFVQLKGLVADYNCLVQRYGQLDGNVIETTEAEAIEATAENLQQIIEKLSKEASQ